MAVFQARYAGQNVELKFPCPVCQQVSHLVISKEQFHAWSSQKLLVQHALPDLKPEERELFISGVCARCFNGMFNDDGESETKELKTPCKHPERN